MNLRVLEVARVYNYFRDYDPNTGRYVESDPIGLEGGLNVYLYASANPVMSVDPTGLNPLTSPEVRHILGHAARGNYSEVVHTVRTLTNLTQKEVSEVLRQCASRRSGELVRQLKRESVGTGARSGQHGVPFSRASAQLRREANDIEKLSKELAQALRTQADRVAAQGRGISH
jgi:uncharacterized protein RhaS with RHS repeats